MMPLKPFSVLLFCHVWITVMLCLLVLQNTSLKNSRKFRIMLLDSSSIAPFDHVTPLLHSLHWLPVHMRIDYQISSLCFKVLDSTVPSYLSDLLHVYTPPPPSPPLPPPPPPAASFFIWWSTFLCSSRQNKVVWCNAPLLIRELTSGTSSHSLFGIRSL